MTKKTSEVTTTRQIATRVKRELVLEDGRLVSDSGPKVSTSVNEDTHTTNLQQTEVNSSPFRSAHPVAELMFRTSEFY